MSPPDISVATGQPSAGRNRLVLIVYTAAIFVSALLLFSVQPLFTKMVLPRLGGSPAVWSVAMVFFQSLLLGGYAYAHYLMQIRNRLIPVVVHLVLLAVALVTLPLSIATGWGEPPTSGYAFWLLGLFAVSIGLPFFALAIWPAAVGWVAQKLQIAYPTVSVLCVTAFLILMVIELLTIVSLQDRKISTLAQIVGIMMEKHGMSDRPNYEAPAQAPIAPTANEPQRIP